MEDSDKIGQFETVQIQDSADGESYTEDSKEAGSQEKANVKRKNITAKQIRDLLAKQGGMCAYTGVELCAENISADHIIPLARGGSHDIENIALVTRQVNYAKGDNTLEDFVFMCKRVAATRG